MPACASLGPGPAAQRGWSTTRCVRRAGGYACAADELPVKRQGLIPQFSNFCRGSLPPHPLLPHPGALSSLITAGNPSCLLAAWSIPAWLHSQYTLHHTTATTSCSYGAGTERAQTQGDRRGCLLPRAGRIQQKFEGGIMWRRHTLCLLSGGESCGLPTFQGGQRERRPPPSSLNPPLPAAVPRAGRDGGAFMHPPLIRMLVTARGRKGLRGWTLLVCVCVWRARGGCARTPY